MPAIPRFPLLPASARLAGVLLLAVALSGCSQVYTVKVDAIRTPEVAPRCSYHLVSADPLRDVTERSFVETVELVDLVLEKNGLYRASRPEWADMIIELDFGVGPQRYVSVPDTTARDANAVAVFVPEKDAVSVAESTGVYVPVGAQTKVVPVYEKHLSLVARESLIGHARGTVAGAQLWRVDVTLQDGAPTIEGLVPILAAAIVDSIDRDDGPNAVKRISTAATQAILVSQSAP